MSTDSNVDTPAYISTVDISDNLLLRRFYISRAPEPFLELVRRHTGMVYGTCFRIVANVHDAEELTQECFFDLSLQAHDVRASVIGWLHQVATHRALNRIRAEKRRKTREQKGIGSTKVIASCHNDDTDVACIRIFVVVIRDVTI